MFFHVLVGIGLAVVGFIAPAMLNMTTVRNSIERGVRSGILFGLGAASVNTIHALLAFSFATYLSDNPSIILWLKKAGILVLVLLSYFFYQKSKQTVKEAKDQKEVHPYIEGILLSSVNMLAIPYYFVASLGISANGIINLHQPYNYYLTVGVLIGAVLIFTTYAYLAKVIAERSQWIAKNISLLLSFLFLILAFIVGVSVLFGG